MNKWYIFILTLITVIDSQYQPTIGKNQQKWQTIYDGIEDATMRYTTSKIL